MFFHTHVHSEFSCLDGMSDIAVMAEKAAKLGQPGIALTDHGNMSGVFQLYNEAKKHNLAPFLGLEAYVVDAIADKKAKRHHLSLIAYTTVGYQNLAKLSSLSHQRDHYHFKPRLDQVDFMQAKGAGATEGIACLTGCYFSQVCQAIVSDPDEEAGYRKAKRYVDFYQSIFDVVYIEVQHHKTQHDVWDDDRLVQALYRLALETGCTPIITNDCHYCDKGDKHLHDMMKSIAYSSDVGDVSFPGDSYHFATEQWVKNHYRNHPDVWEAAQSAYTELIDLNTLAIPVLDKYQYHVPVVDSDPMQALTDLCYQRMGDMGTEYEERLGYELGVIRGLAMSDYFLLVSDYVDWCKEQGILVMARGSAAGSLVCWLLGFTQVDPLKWNLTFDRFLTPDRERPPDIDLDIESDRRADVVEYLQGKYQISQIGTYNRLTYDEETGRGGLFVQYMSAQRKILKEDFPRVLGRIKTLHDLDQIRPDDALAVRALGDVALRRSPGAHAAGFVVSAPPALSIDEWLPTMLIPSSDTTVTQMMMDDVEDAGYIKVDLLGLRSLTTVRRCYELVEPKVGVQEWLESIPLDDADTFNLLRSGNAETGVFQLEGYTAAKGCREVRVKSLADLILVNALYRPATRDAGYTKLFLDNRKKPKSVRYTHPIFEKHLGETFGVPAFQEQVLSILRDLGMPTYELNAFLKAVKGKHAKGGYSDISTAIFDTNRSRFIGLCVDAGMDSMDAEESWDLVEGFAAYGFNRAHATAYALLGYQMAYMKVHHPIEFHAALLETSVGTPKESQYVKESRRAGIPLTGACVNRSGGSWQPDPKGKSIRKGLTAIKGVGVKAATAIVEESPYDSVDEIIDRCPAKAVTGGKSWKKEKTLNGVLGLLRDAGALKQLGVMPR